MQKQARAEGAWTVTSQGDARGYIQPQRLDELWFHTGTNCNLRCPFCLEGSKPGNDRIGFITLAEAEPLMREALGHGVKTFSFTGGEPFINPEMLAILDAALELRPCLVLTNATEPLLNQLGRLQPLLAKPHPLNLRVSIDYPDAAAHDRGRGPGSFRTSWRCIEQLHAMGVGVSIARLMRRDEETPAVEAAFHRLFAEHGLPKATRIVAFPDFLGPGAHPDDVPEITESCMTTYLSAEQRDAFMCNFSKMVVKKGDQIGIYACTLVDDDDDYNLGTTLAEAMRTRVMMRHHRCYSCFSCGASCSEL